MIRALGPRVAILACFGVPNSTNAFKDGLKAGWTIYRLYGVVLRAFLIASVEALIPHGHDQKIRRRSLMAFIMGTFNIFGVWNFRSTTNVPCFGVSYYCLV
eukprot:SAG31_NODE_152_length_22216_cov_16.550029_11_plen_101_part_00